MVTKVSGIDNILGSGWMRFVVMVCVCIKA